MTRGLQVGARIDGGRILVDEKPVLLLGGELHNSSSSSSRSMAPRWAGIVEAGCNTVLAAVAWEQLEPEEGRFDTTAVDALLEGARTHGLRLVLLWFGSWKNGMSTYVPPWVKADRDRFPTQHLGGRSSSVLSPFSQSNRDADARAFAALLAHLHRVDAQGTVVMVQIENEVGSLGDSRDRSPAAEQAWRSPVPEGLLALLRDRPTPVSQQLRVQLDSAAEVGANWADAFDEGESTDELFMAWHLASYIEHVARVGRAEHELPMYVNAWLSAEEGGADALSGGNSPGDYPSGSPLPHVAAAWFAAAPTIDFLAPDIYADEDEAWLQRFAEVSPVIFVPELHRSRRGLETIVHAIGSHRAIGTAPFGIDELEDDDRRNLRRLYTQLASIAEDIIDAQGTGRIRGFVVRPGEPHPIELGGFRLNITPDIRLDERIEVPNVGYGVVVLLDDGRFVVAGHGFLVWPQTLDGQPAVMHTVHELDPAVPFGRASELPIVRWLNGDEILHGQAIWVTGEPLRAWPNGIPLSTPISGPISFTLLDPEAP